MIHVVPGTLYSGNLVSSGTLAVAGVATFAVGVIAQSTVTVGTTLRVHVIATPVAAAGSVYTDAAAIGVADVVEISSDSAAKGVKLLTGVAGQQIIIINTTATACKLYPATGGTLSGLSANANVTIAASHIVKCICTAADTWFVEDMGAFLAA